MTKIFFFLLLSLKYIFSSANSTNILFVNMTKPIIPTTTINNKPPLLIEMNTKIEPFCGGAIKNSQQYINCDLLHDFIPLAVSYSILAITILYSVVSSKFMDSSSSYFNKYVNICNKIQITRGTLGFCIIYFLWWLGMLTYSFVTNDKNEALFRLGIWISLNMATVLLPITRNSIWIILFKISYDRIIHIHKFIAILCLISIIVKLIAVLVYFNFIFLFIPYNESTGGSPLGGTLSSLAMLLIAFLSIPYIRRNFFEVFYFSHRILCYFSIAAGIWHFLLTLYYILPTFLLYIIDIILRFLNTKKALYSHLKIIGDEDKNTLCIFMTISLLKPIKTPPGSYFFICFKEISSVEWHPLSLITQNHDTLTFCAKDMGKGSWTNKIRLLDESRSLKSKLKDSPVLLQGPYGHINIDYKNNKYKYLILVAGGIGITPILSILYDINHNHRKFKHLKHIYLIWVVPHSSLVDGLSFFLKYLNKEIFTISIYSTYKKIEEGCQDNYFNIQNSRPKMSNIINSIYDENKMISSELGVSCCGPHSMSNDVIISCSKLNIDICNENF